MAREVILCMSRVTPWHVWRLALDWCQANYYGIPYWYIPFLNSSLCHVARSSVTRAEAVKCDNYSQIQAVSPGSLSSAVSHDSASGDTFLLHGRRNLACP
jgi:hypothetical protein